MMRSRRLVLSVMPKCTCAHTSTPFRLLFIIGPFSFWNLHACVLFFFPPFRAFYLSPGIFESFFLIFRVTKAGKEKNIKRNRVTCRDLRCVYARSPAKRLQRCRRRRRRKKETTTNESFWMIWRHLSFSSCHRRGLSDSFLSSILDFYTKWRYKIC